MGIAEYKEGIIHQLFECDNCDWKNSDYIHGEDLATDHADESGHTVRGEAVTSIKIVGKVD